MIRRHRSAVAALGFALAALPLFFAAGCSSEKNYSYFIVHVSYDTKSINRDTFSQIHNCVLEVTGDDPKADDQCNPNPDDAVGDRLAYGKVDWVTTASSGQVTFKFTALNGVGANKVQKACGTVGPIDVTEGKVGYYETDLIVYGTPSGTGCPTSEPTNDAGSTD